MFWPGFSGSSPARAFAAVLCNQPAAISARLDRIDLLDQQIDQAVFALYRITDPVEQARGLGSAPRGEEDADVGAAEVEGVGNDAVAE